MRALLAAVVTGLSVSGCAHTVTNEQRLDGLTDAVLEPQRKLEPLRCSATAPEVQRARDAAGSTAGRLEAYRAALAEAKQTSAQLDEAFRKDPDLIYGASAAEWTQRASACAELTAALEREQQRLHDITPEPAVVATPSPTESAPEHGADQLRATYTKKPKVAKAQKALAKKRRGVSLAAR